MANTLIKDRAAPGTNSGGGSGGSGGSGGGGGSGSGGSSCQAAQNAAVGQLFPGYQFSAGTGTSGNGGGVVTGPSGDQWTVTGGSCNGASVSIDYKRGAL